jgi:hypothetical protein
LGARRSSPPPGGTAPVPNCGWLYDGNQRWEDLRPDLLPADRDRPQHQPIHTTVYMRWVRDYLDSYATMNGTCLSDIGMLGELREMKGKIIAGKAKF